MTSFEGLTPELESCSLEVAGMLEGFAVPNFRFLTSLRIDEAPMIKCLLGSFIVQLAFVISI